MSVFCLLAALAAGLSTTANANEQSQAKEAIAAFAGALKAELTAAMQAGGPLNAIEVCNSRAPSIAESVSLDTGMRLSRVSLANRNPDNAPDPWQAAVLEQFEQRLAAGEPAGSLTWQDTSLVDGRRMFRFMQAIPTGALCLQCHGEAIAPAVAQKIAERYPDDKATGFREGDLRGAFVVTKDLAQ